jgi:N-acetylglucosamine malate deacetylase 1
MRVLAVGAHPDDVELLCAGSLAIYVANGAHVTIAVMTDGALGSTTCPGDEIASIRRVESERAAHVLDADLIWVGQPDGFLFDGPTTRRLAVDVVRRARPDIVFTHHPLDYHPDHRTTSELISTARLLAREPGLTGEHPALLHVPSLVFMDTFMSDGSPEPDVWVDITATMPTKEAMLAEHVTQNARRRSTGKPDFVASMLRQAAVRGAEVDSDYAEAFHLSRSHPATSVEDLGAPDGPISLPVLTRAAPKETNERA